MLLSRRVLSVSLASAATAWLASGCSKDVRTASSDDLVKTLDAQSPADRLDTIKRLAQQGESALPRIRDAFSKAASKPDLQAALAEAVFRMSPSENTISGLERMSKEARDPAVREQIGRFANQRKASQAGSAGRGPS